MISLEDLLIMHIEHRLKKSDIDEYLKSNKLTEDQKKKIESLLPFTMQYNTRFAKYIKYMQRITPILIPLFLFFIYKVLQKRRIK